MDNDIDAKTERKLAQWEKGLYACFGMVFTMFVSATIKAWENIEITNVLAYIKRNTKPINPATFWNYDFRVDFILISPWRMLLLAIVELTLLISIGILLFHPTWRKIPIFKRVDLIFGFFLAAWVGLLSHGAQNPLDAGNDYNAFVVGYILVLVLGYWRLRNKKERVEDVFP